MFAAEFTHGIYGDGEAVLQLLKDLSGQLVIKTQWGASSGEKKDLTWTRSHVETAGVAYLRVKKFSRRLLLQTGGIATRVWTASVLLARWMGRHLDSLLAISHCAYTSDAESRDTRYFGTGGGRVLELGCGLGVAGMAAAMCGCKVLLTDVHQVALSSCRSSIAINADMLKSSGSPRAFLNGGHLQSIDEFLKASQLHTCDGLGQAFTMLLDWTSLPDLPPHEQFSCIIAADVIHEDQHAPLVARVIRVRADFPFHLGAHSFVLQRMLAPRGVCIVSNPDARSRYGMDEFPRQLQEEGLRIIVQLPLPLVPPERGEDETLFDVSQLHIIIITHMQHCTSDSA